MKPFPTRAVIFLAAMCLTATPSLAQSPDQIRAICKDDALQEKMLAQVQGNRRLALEIEIEARCAQVDMPKTPVHDTADTSPAGSHNGWVRDARYSADGRTIVSGGRDGKARTWDAVTGRPIREMTGADDYQVEAEIRGGEAYAVRFVGDGKRIASAGTDDMVRVLEAATGKVIVARPMTPPQPAGTPAKIAASASGLLFVAGHRSDVEAIDISKIESGAQAMRYRLRGHGAAATAVAASDVGDIVATASVDRSASPPSARVYLWRLSTGDKIGAFTPEGASTVNVLAFSRDGARLAVVNGGNVHIVTVADKRVTQTLKLPSTSTPFDVAFTADGSGLITCTTHPILWDVASARRIRHFGPFMDLCHSVDVSPDGRFAVTTAMNSDLRVWEIATGTFHRRIGRAGPPQR